MSAEKIWSYCSLCDAPLDADNCYGEDDFPLCRYHHEKFGLAVAYLTVWSDELKVNKQDKPEEFTQPGLGI